MNLSYVYRRALLLSIAVLLAVSLLAVALVSLPVFDSTAQYAPHVGHVTAPQSPASGVRADGSPMPICIPPQAC
jgi:hypothetical protein